MTFETMLCFAAFLGAVAACGLGYSFQSWRGWSERLMLGVGGTLYLTVLSGAAGWFRSGGSPRAASSWALVALFLCIPVLAPAFLEGLAEIREALTGKNLMYAAVSVFLLTLLVLALAGGVFFCLNLEQVVNAVKYNPHV